LPQKRSAFGQEFRLLMTAQGEVIEIQEGEKVGGDLYSMADFRI
jgi:hypothetical protein